MPPASVSESMESKDADDVRAAAHVGSTDSPEVKPEPHIKLAGVSKAFGGVIVLNDAGLSLEKGEVHALLGANGSGKSTLIKVITGYHEPEPGARAWIGPREAQFTRQGLVPENGSRFVIRAVHQELGLIGRLSVVDNMALIAGYSKRPWGSVHWSRQVVRTRELLALVGQEDLDVRKPVDQCEPIERTQIAIARAIADWDGDDGLLILDEPTATLPEDQVQHLFSIIRAVQTRGITVLYVSHRLSEVFAVADRVTALREGNVVGTRPVSELTRESMVELIMGLTLAPTKAPTSVSRPVLKSGGKPVLSVRNVESAKLRGISFDLQPGEALGFAGLVGSGLGDLPYHLVGAVRASAGEIEGGGCRIPAAKMTQLRATAMGIGLMPASRLVEGLHAKWPVSMNITLPQIHRFQKRGWLRRRDEKAYTRDWIDELGVVPPDPDKEVGLLSGGNQQKVLLAKWLGVATSVLVAAEPTAGVDVHAKELIYRELIRRRDQGLSLIICSTDLLDLVRVCSRVIALADGKMIGEFEGDQITEDNILSLVLHRDTAELGESERVGASV